MSYHWDLSRIRKLPRSERELFFWMIEEENKQKGGMEDG
jgi:hypothetical protein